MAQSLYDASIHPLARLQHLGDGMRTIAGRLLTTLLTLSAGCARTDWIDRALVTVDVTGTWEGTLSTGIGLSFELQQQGPTVKGSMRLTTGSSQNPTGIRPGPIEGTVAGDVFRFRQLNGSAEGEMTVSGDEMNGRATLGYILALSLRRVDPSSRPVSPPR